MGNSQTINFEAGQVLRGTFTTRDRTGAAVDADSLPTGAQVLANGSALTPTTDYTVTVTDIGSGRYGYEVTWVTSRSARDLISVDIAATIGGTATGILDDFEAVSASGASPSIDS
jgi:hypothetical protein